MFPFFIENLGYGSTGLGISFLHLLQNIQTAKSSAERADEDRGPGSHSRRPALQCYFLSAANSEAPALTLCYQARSPPKPRVKRPNSELLPQLGKAIPNLVGNLTPALPPTSPGARPGSAPQPVSRLISLPVGLSQNSKHDHPSALLAPHSPFSREHAASRRSSPTRAREPDGAGFGFRGRA